MNYPNPTPNGGSMQDTDAHDDEQPLANLDRRDRIQTTDKLEDEENEELELDEEGRNEEDPEEATERRNTAAGGINDGVAGPPQSMGASINDASPGKLGGNMGGGFGSGA